MSSVDLRTHVRLTFLSLSFIYACISIQYFYQKTSIPYREQTLKQS